MELKTTIAHEGQPYVDEPVYANPKQRSKSDLSVATAFGNDDHPRRIEIGRERVLLRWMKPDGHGGLVPR